jgi:hypothetical protein
MADQFVDLLAEDQYFWSLCQDGFSVTGSENFERKLRRLIRHYARWLSRAAATDTQRIAAKHVRLQSNYLATAVRQRCVRRKSQSKPPELQPKLQEVDSRQGLMLDRYVESSAEETLSLEPGPEESDIPAPEDSDIPAPEESDLAASDFLEDEQLTAREVTFRHFSISLGDVSHMLRCVQSYIFESHLDDDPDSSEQATPWDAGSFSHAAYEETAEAVACSRQIFQGDLESSDSDPEDDHSLQRIQDLVDLKPFLLDGGAFKEFQEGLEDLVAPFQARKVPLADLSDDQRKKHWSLKDAEGPQVNLLMKFNIIRLHCEHIMRYGKTYGIQLPRMLLHIQRSCIVSVSDFYDTNSKWSVEEVRNHRDEALITKAKEVVSLASIIESPLWTMVTYQENLRKQYADVKNAAELCLEADIDDLSPSTTTEKAWTPPRKSLFSRSMQTIRNLIRPLTRPKVPAGFRRIEWKCVRSVAFES